jgi:hypothetical protein
LLPNTNIGISNRKVLRTRKAFSFYFPFP